MKTRKLGAIRRLPIALAGALGVATLFGPAQAKAQDTTQRAPDTTQARAQETTQTPSTEETRALDKLRQTFAREPTPSEVLVEAMHYFRVHPATADSLRSATHTRALFPVLSAVGTYNAYGDASAQSVTITNPQNTLINDYNRSYNLAVGVAWDLRELGFNPSELQVYSLVGYQQDLIQEITRTYFMRRQLQIRLALRPPQDLVTREILDLRVAEYTAILDAMTGGWFLRYIEQQLEAERPQQPSR
jgi:hypothetical protein